MMVIGDEVVVMKIKVVKRGKKKLVKDFSGTVVGFVGTIGFHDDELVYKVVDNFGTQHEVQETLLKRV